MLKKGFINLNPFFCQRQPFRKYHVFNNEELF